MDYMKKIVYHSNYWYNDGLRKAQMRDMSGAIASLRRSLQFNRENIAARNLLGLVYYGIGEVPEALVEWIISKNLRARDNIADYYIKNVQASAKELETINLAIRKYNQCLTYCQQNGEDLAVIQLKQVISAHPTFLKAYQLLALIYLHTEQYPHARQILRTARKLDTTNEITLHYTHELVQQKGRRRREKKKEDAVEYNLGNETIIQPKHSRIKEMAGQLAVANIFIGAAIGAAVIWFLVAPAVNQSRADRMNDQMREYSEEIKSLEAQVSAQTRTLDNYRASGESAETAAQETQTIRDSYENLLYAQSQYDSRQYTDAEMADSLLNVSRDSLGTNAQAVYDELTAAIFPGACETNFATGIQALNGGDYQGAVDALSKVVRMDEGYNSGQALFSLAQAYQGNGDNENAVTYYQRVVEGYADSEYAAQAQSSLDAISQNQAAAQ
ncbi:MAG TPA: tetratricopeptide repeat protein [Candidatus Mediterraneibacter stercorigallinarum]|uniref:Tetratricopeptide repeat protein n=1 Tax=Candidatus Mediterraneibacter stercorigallinarum TaxID=2838686 RepID=A0A9D2DC08_9FIRM|nr:tetratricopeptide repeat protein [Candidatus Mediterraneibacter stercorigallinarum]